MNVNAADVLLDARSASPSVFTGIAAASASAGNAGNLRIQAGSLQVLGGAQVTSSTSGTGNGGRVDATATDVLLDGRGQSTQTGIFARSESTGPGERAGDVALHATSQLSAVNGARISSTTFGQGAGGNVSIDAHDILFDAGNVPVSVFTGVAAASDSPGAGGDAGNVTLQAGTLQVVGGAQVASSTAGLGKGGEVQATARHVFLSGAGSISAGFTGISAASTSTGQGGDAGFITVTAGDFQVVKGAQVLALSQGSGNGGDIRVAGASSLSLSRSLISAVAPGRGGNIRLSAKDLVYMLDSRLVTRTNNGGSIDLNGDVIAVSASRLLAAAVPGGGGNIQISPDHFLRSNSAIEATGTIQAALPDTTVAGSLAVLPQALATPIPLAPRCGLELGGNISSFIVSGEGGTPVEPGGWAPALDLRSPQILRDKARR